MDLVEFFTGLDSDFGANSHDNILLFVAAKQIAHGSGNEV
jgi:hypothetical protein